MNWGPWLYLLFLFIFSNIIASFFIGWMLWRQRNGTRLISLLAILFFSITFQGVCELIANAFGYAVKPRYTIGFGVSLWLGRFVFFLSSWALALYLTGLRRKKGSLHVKEKTDEAEAEKEG